MKHIAIAGLGVVGGGVAEILLKNAALLEKNAGEPIALKSIYTRTQKKDSPFASYYVPDFSAIEQDPDIDLVVETIGGSTVALDVVSRALKAGDGDSGTLRGDGHPPDSNSRQYRSRCR